ncbi:MAG: tRNA (adenosine(37)-N6)-threonylcarbamoyltransferase complex transferase subunit TsaD, partial [Patescibacteria group bacterium]
GLPAGRQAGVKILANIVATSAEMHAVSGGVIPEEAARQQVRSIIPVVKEALATSRESLKKIDAIAVTVGPGLIGSLLVGTETAKTLAYLHQKPIIPVNHLLAHIYANWLDSDIPSFPALALVVSGGHTDMVLMRGHGKIEWLGGTRDDASGEAFDKTARLLGLPYPGGPQIAKLADDFRRKNPNHIYDLFPRPMINEGNFDFSFSGLKTAVNKEVVRLGDKASRKMLAADVQEAITDVLVEKTLRAVQKFKPESLLLAGGVAANQRLREKFAAEIESRKLRVEFFVPPPALCTDNATYVAAYAYFSKTTTDWRFLEANPELTITTKV